ncbi:hypothetical protein MCUN1_000979 [Malassezia cuniculi]|uniref:LAA1-like C-terminal TPR repeats domain-containing protein n=1 Tax=Malassezia cuniculi TaxID=948313 RepID=A0AAF0ENY0_9BASI|nr:hypothetical protein MCUN1_000979 [Malassezia cuniculi]
MSAAIAARPPDALPDGLPSDQALRDAIAAGHAESFVIVALQHIDDAALNAHSASAADLLALLVLLLRIIGVDRLQDDVWNHVEPGRAARLTVGRALCRIYDHAAPRPLFQLVGALLAAAVAVPHDNDHVQRLVAILHVLAELFVAHGNNLHSMLADAAAASLRIFKSSAVPLVRAHALSLLHILFSLGAPTSKDLQKALRAALADKAGPVVRAAAACLAYEPQKSVADAEALIAACVRAHPCDQKTLRALARLVAVVLTKKLDAPPPADDQPSHDDDEPQKGPALRPLFAVSEQLDLLRAHFAKAQNWPARSAVLHMYHALFALHGNAWIEANYQDVVRHILGPLAAGELELAAAPADAARLRAATRALLRSLGAALREPAQEGAAVAIGDLLNAWPPPTPDVQPPSDTALVLALSEAAALVDKLAVLPTSLIDAVYAPAIRTLSHPSPAVRAHAAWCIATLCRVHPGHIAPTTAELLGFLRRDIAALSSAQPDAGVALRARLCGHSTALAAIVHVTASLPLYTSAADADALYALATDLLEHGGSLPLPQAAAAVAAAWSILAALFSFGPDYARGRLSLFLTLWRNALGRTVDAPGDAECAFLCHVRLHALAALLAFLAHGGAELLSAEASRRVVVSLSRALHFVENIRTHPTAPSGVPGVLPTRDAVPLLRARLMRCFAQLADNPATVTLLPQLVSLTVQYFGRPEHCTGSAAQAQISATAGQYTGLWSARDNIAYGATSFIRLADASQNSAYSALAAWRRGAVLLPSDPHMPLPDYLDALAATPILGSIEHDVMSLYVASAALPTPVPAATAQTDAALELFAALLPYAPRDAQISTCESLAGFLRSPLLDKNPGRRMAVLSNYTVGLLGALRTSMHSSTRGSGFANDRVSAACRTVAQAALLQGDQVLRPAAAELYGRLAAAGGSPALGAQVQFLVEQIVDNRNADARASCAHAAGEIYHRVGGLSAAPLTNTLSSLLMSLAADAHPAVHYAALAALCRIIEAAGVGYQSHVNSTLGLLVRLYAVPTHEPEGGSAGSTNLRATLPVYAVLARTVGALVGVLGPDLQQGSSKHSLISALLHQLVLDSQPPAADALEALQQLSLVIPGVLDSETSMRRLGAFVQSNDLALQKAAVSAYYQLVQRGPEALVQHGGRKLLATLLALVDAQPTLDGVRAVLAAWLLHSAPARPVAWIDICRSVLLVPGALGMLAGQASTGAAKNDTDDEDAVIQLEATGDSTISWHTHLFVLQCVHDVLVVTTDPAHVGRTSDAASPHSLASRVGDLIKIAVGASNAPHTPVRLLGLQTLRDVVERFHDTPDPAFPDTRLLEQFQAPITAALMPAFAADSTPEVLAAAVRVCAVCITAGIEQGGGGRIERQLIAALDQTIAGGDTVGSLTNMAPAAVAHVRLAVLSAWADLQTATQPPALLQPRMATLLRAWIGALTQYAAARVGAESDAAAPLCSVNGVLAPLVRTHVLHDFGSAWPRILQAVSVACTHSPDAVREALDAGDVSSTCVALYALAFETLCDELGHHSTRDRTVLNAALSSLSVLVDVRYSGEFLLHTVLYDELLELIQRAFLVEDTAVQLGVIHVVRTLVLSYRERLLEGDDSMAHDDALWSTKLGALLRAVHAYIARLPHAHRPVADKAQLLGAALQASLDMAQVCVTHVQADLVAILFSILADYTRREDDAAHMLPSVLPVLRPLCARACALSVSLGTDDMARVVHGYLSSAINEADALRARAGATVDAKRRNALVSVSLALVALDAHIPIAAAVVERFSFLLGQQLKASPAEALGALQCIRPIVLASASNDVPSLRALVGMLLPHLLEYIIREAPSLEAPASVEQAFDVLHLFVRAMPASYGTAALCITLPVFVYLAKHAGIDAPIVRTVCAQLVGIAQDHAAAFKHASASLPPDDRNTVHEALKRALNVTDAPTRAPRGGTSISLQSMDQATAAVDPALPVAVAPIPSSSARPAPEKGILRASRASTAPWFARDFVSVINTRLAQQGVPVKVPTQAGALFTNVMKRIGFKETDADDDRSPGTPTEAAPDPPTPRMKHVHFRYDDLTHTYPITSTTAPGTEHATLARVENERRAAVAERQGRPLSPPELIALYRVCCHAREEPVNISVVKVLDQAKEWDKQRPLNFSNTRLAEGFAPVADLLGVPLGVQSLSFDACALDSKAVHDLAHAIKASNSVHTLSLADNDIKRDGWAALGQLLQDGPLQSLDVSGNSFSRHYIYALLQRGCVLVSLRFDRCNLRTSALEAISDTVRTLDIQHLSLRRNKIGMISANALAAVLQDYHDAARPIITSAEAVHIMPCADVYTSEPGPVVGTLLSGQEEHAPSSTSRIERINALVERTRALQRSFNRTPRTSTLLTLDLKSNQIRSGISSLATALRRNRTLRVLNLSDNGLDEAAFVTLCGALRYNTTLETLDVSHNPCCGPSLKGVLALREVLAVHPRLKRVFLSATCLASDGALALAECLPDARSLIHLDLSQNSINIAGLMALEVGLRMNTNVRCLDVSIPQGPEALQTARAIYDSLMRNTSNALERAYSDTTRRQAVTPLRKSALAAALAESDALTDMLHLDQPSGHTPCPSNKSVGSGKSHPSTDSHKSTDPLTDATAAIDLADDSYSRDNIHSSFTSFSASSSASSLASSSPAADAAITAPASAATDVTDSAREDLTLEIPVCASSDDVQSPIQHANELLNEEGTIFRRAKSIGIDADAPEPVAREKSGDELRTDILADDGAAL